MKLIRELVVNMILVVQIVSIEVDLVWHSVRLPHTYAMVRKDHDPVMARRAWRQHDANIHEDILSIAL